MVRNVIWAFINTEVVKSIGYFGLEVIDEV